MWTDTSSFFKSNFKIIIKKQTTSQTCARRVGEHQYERMSCSMIRDIRISLTHVSIHYCLCVTEHQKITQNTQDYWLSNYRRCTRSQQWRVVNYTNEVQFEGNQQRHHGKQLTHTDIQRVCNINVLPSVTGAFQPRAHILSQACRDGTPWKRKRVGFSRKLEKWFFHFLKSW